MQEPHKMELQQQPGAVTIRAEKLGKKFNYEWIFKELSFTFSFHHLYAVTGPNGAGKSTLLQVLWGQMPATSGSIHYERNGKEISGDDIFRYISIATPYMDLIEELTLLEQLQFHFKMKPSRNGMTAEEMLERMYLSEARDKYISNFSSGMKQRVKLALAFYTKADIIFLDEPGTNLDRQAFDWYLQNLDNAASESLVFIASNQQSEYPANAQKIDIMSYK